jgi:ribonuclease BN (tRNA processing enzyme)
VRVHILGSNGTYPTPGRPASGYLVEHGETRVWCDAGPGTFLELWQRVELDLLSGVVVSHRHPDHCADLLAAYHALAYGPYRRPPVPVWGPESVWRRMVAFLDPSERLRDAFDFHPVGDDDMIQIDGVAVSFATTDHSVTCVASRWEADGRVFVFTGDTGAAGTWRRLATGADVLLSEATYQGEPGLEPYTQHLTAGEAGAIAREAGARRLVLTHIPAHLDTARSLEEAERTFDRPVSVAVPGAVHHI